jgi:hypothetical protein
MLSHAIGPRMWRRSGTMHRALHRSRPIRPPTLHRSTRGATLKEATLPKKRKVKIEAQTKSASNYLKVRRKARRSRP